MDRWRFASSSTRLTSAAAISITCLPASNTASTPWPKPWVWTIACSHFGCAGARRRSAAKSLFCSRPYEPIGSASCRERVCLYVLFSVFAVSLHTHLFFFFFFPLSYYILFFFFFFFFFFFIFFF